MDGVSSVPASAEWESEDALASAGASVSTAFSVGKSVVARSVAASVLFRAVAGVAVGAGAGVRGVGEGVFSVGSTLRSADAWFLYQDFAAGDRVWEESQDQSRKAAGFIALVRWSPSAGPGLTGRRGRTSQGDGS